MFTDHIKAHRFGYFNVISQSSIGRRGVDPVRLEAPIERTHLEQELVVQHEFLISVYVCNRYFPHSEITVY